ncbi:MAG: tRNA 2-thiouridine(34) synthase MnmA [bacterium]|nr:tRNA 2-thiouridine(34) synthase MnmA [bacterium]
MKIALLLSGGVDSSVALHLLRRAGHDLTAFYLKIWLEDELAFLGDCPWEEDLKYARAVCEQASVPLNIVPLQAEYLDRVVSHALDELRAGRTPSPDILCNRRIKFGEFTHHIDAGFEKIASGHYAQIEQQNDTFYLKRSPDPIKDQTYFLSGLTQEQLSHALFPIGHLTKEQVRQHAQEFNLPNRERKDSQGICFLGKISYPDFVKFHLGEKPGNIVEQETGHVLGPHNGFWFYTIGQRNGLGLAGGPWYVVQKDTQSNVIYVSHKDRRETQKRDRFTVSSLNWISGPPDRTDLQVKLRHGPKQIACTIAPTENNHLRVTLTEKDPGIAPGQTAVFYNNETCLGGGVIE